MSTRPRLVGLRLQTLAVIAGKACSGSPKASRLSGWTWNSRLAWFRPGSDRVNAPSWLGAMLIGPLRRSAYSIAISALPRQLAASSFSVRRAVTL